MDQAAGSKRQAIFKGARTLSIMPTYTCTAACENCASLSSPKVREKIELATILDAIRQAKELGFYNVVFTGGEATLRWKDLLEGISYAHALGLPTRLVTNAHWALSEQAAERQFGVLADAGLEEINYSTGDEHVRFVPIERVAHACVAAARRGFRVWVMVESRARRAVTAHTVTGHPILDKLSSTERERIDVFESPWMPLDPGTIEGYAPGAAATSTSLNAHMPCHNVLQTYTVQADGRVGACCGIGMRTIPELNVGTVHAPDFLKVAIEESESDFLKLWMHYKGPDQILAWAASKDPSIAWEGLYAHRCQACARVYKDPRVGEIIREHYEEMVAEVLQTAFIDEHCVPALHPLD
jgi:hypothetical protein